ncbi:hypothetical protein ACOBQJ_11425 [Pelotomaculum propionicicum]|uniref:hypothetical protein n=1 Tax=Pelotomaculum propionicicum TaxID=258475 RepID=UPI003B79F342
MPLSTLDELRGIAAKWLAETKGKSGYSYWHGKKRVLKLATYKDSIFIELTINIPDRAGLLTLSDDDRARLHAGATKQCYVGSDLIEAKKIIESAFVYY